MRPRESLRVEGESVAAESEEGGKVVCEGPAKDAHPPNKCLGALHERSHHLVEKLEGFREGGRDVHVGSDQNRTHLEEGGGLAVHLPLVRGD